MSADDNSKWLLGLECARKLNFTDAQYEEAIKEIESPDNANQLLEALIDISSRDDTSTCAGKQQQQQQHLQQNDDKTGFSMSSSSASSSTQIHDTASSYSSSLSSFPSSFGQSLESLHQHHHHSHQHQPQSYPAFKRKIYVDGANVARTHGKHASFSWPGILLCVQWFVDRQYLVRVFVPADRCHQADQATLDFLNELGALVECPSGCNDDMFVIEAARQNNGVIVSNDLYRDEKQSNSHDLELRRFIDNNRLPYVFVDDLFIPASDPLGRTGPSLDEFLSVTTAPEVILGNRTRSYQRYSRGNQGFQTRRFHSTSGRRTLQSVRSLPVGQTEVAHMPALDTSQYHQNYTHSFDQRRPVHRATCGLYKSSHQRE